MCAVVSAVSGLKQASDAVTDKMIVGVSCAVLVLLFAFQYLGTNKVMEWVPILSAWDLRCWQLATMSVRPNPFSHDLF